MSTLTPSHAAAPAPSAHRRALTTWLAVYPAITATLYLIGPSTAHLPLLVRTLILTGIVVPSAVYVLIPSLNRLQASAHAVHVGGRRARLGRSPIRNEAPRM